MPSTEEKAKVIEILLENCRHSTQRPLGFLEVDDDVYDCPSDSESLVYALTQKLSIEDLIDSGIVVVREDGIVALSPALSGGKTFVVMRDAVTHQPYELLTPVGCLAADVLPVFEILRDSYTQRLLENGSEYLFIAFDLEHVVLLRACGLPATLAEGLDDFRLELVDEFCESFGLSRLTRCRAKSRKEVGAERESQFEYDPADPIRGIARYMMPAPNACETEALAPDITIPTRVSAQPIRAQLVLLGWTPLELSSAVPPQLMATVHHLLQLQRFMGVDVDDIGFWEVDGEWVERLRFIAERNSAAIFKEALLEAADEIGAGIGQFGTGQSLAIGPPSDYTSALARLQEAVLRDPEMRLRSSTPREQAWRDIQGLLSQQVIGPLRELALATGDPLQRNLLMGFAELSHVFHMQSVAMVEQLTRQVAHRGVESSGQLPEDQFKNLMAMADRLIGMAKATERCSQPRMTIIESRTIDSPRFRQLPHSG